MTTKINIFLPKDILPIPPSCIVFRLWFFLLKPPSRSYCSSGIHGFLVPITAGINSPASHPVPLNEGSRLRPQGLQNYDIFNAFIVCIPLLIVKNAMDAPLNTLQNTQYVLVFHLLQLLLRCDKLLPDSLRQIFLQELRQHPFCRIRIIIFSQRNTIIQ